MIAVDEPYGHIGFDLWHFWTGQGISLIVGLGDYSGGELCVENDSHDIRQALNNSAGGFVD